MNNAFNNYEFPEERNNFSVVINVVTCFVCGSLGLITFLKLLRMYNYDELYKEGYLQLSLLIFIAAMLAVFFIVRKFDIDFEKPTAAILLLMSSAIIIFSVILFFNASNILFYALVFILLVCDLLLCIFTHLTIQTKVIAIIISVVSLITVNSIACKNLEFKADQYYFSLNNIYTSDTSDNRTYCKFNIPEEDYDNIQQSVNDFYTHQMLPITSVNEWEDMFDKLSIGKNTQNDVHELLSAGKNYDDAFFKDNSLFLCLLPLENANDYVNIDKIVVAEGMTSLRYTYYKNTSAQNAGKGFILTVITVDKKNEELLKKASYITDIDGETVCSKKTVVEV